MKWLRLKDPEDELEKTLLDLREVNKAMRQRALQLALQARALESEDSDENGKQDDA